MAVDRRTALKIIAAGTAAIACEPAASAAAEPKEPPPDAVGLLYDATRCIGCKSCVVACKQANGLPPDRDAYYGAIYSDARTLSATTKTIVKGFASGDRQSYVKAQCMHCVDPACVSACMLGALQKREHGIVTWEGSRCVGCRYCQVACAFGVPKFEWTKAVPKIVKCEMCKHLLAKGEIPACAQVCPRQAVVFGSYQKLLEDAHARIDNDPTRYEPTVYGETEGGGTQMLYLSRAGISFQELGLPDLGNRPVPAPQQELQHSIYQGFVAPAALYVVLAGVLWRNRSKGEQEQQQEEKKR